MNKVLVIVASCAFVSEVGAQQPAHGPQGQSGLVYSDTTSFWIDAPHGWVLDAESGKRDGPLVVLYRQGESWRTGEPVMYASVLTPKTGGFNAVVPAAARTDSAQWAGQAPDLVYAVRDSIRTTSGAYAHIRTFQSVSTHHFDTVAYLQAEGRVWILVLTARSLAAREAANADFEALVKSYAPGPMRQSQQKP